MQRDEVLCESGPLRIGGLDFQVSIKPKRKTVRLVVERDAALVIEAPAGVARSAVENAVRRRLPWIYTKLAIRQDQVDAQPIKEFVTGEGFYFLGQSYRLKIVESHPQRVDLVSDRLLLRRDRVVSAEGDLIAWYAQQGRSWLPSRAASWADRMATPVPELNVRRLGYRWGSCSTSGRLNIHWATMQLPSRLIDYVLVHELAHLRCHDHSSEFWRAMARPMPDYAERRAQLDEWGAQLWLPEPADSLK